MMHVSKSLACVIVLIAGCANPINQKNASSYYEWGVEAELAGDYLLAERNYSRALVNARLGHSPEAGVSAATYGLGRMKGYLCNPTEAEPLLVEALTLEEKVSGPGSGLVTKRLFELARFYSDRGYHEQSLQYFERGIPAVKRLGIETSDPLSLADALDEYAAALDKTGKNALAEQPRMEAKSLRLSSPGQVAKFTPVRYNRACPK